MNYTFLLLMIALVIAVQFQEKAIGDDPCYNKPCKNNGLCTATPNGYNCQCPEGFDGKNCEECRLVDNDIKQCPLWAYHNECKKNPENMNRNCAKSCGCGCIDHASSCAEWAERGACNKNPKYMKPYCPKSCGLCS